MSMLCNHLLLLLSGVRCQVSQTPENDVSDSGTVQIFSWHVSEWHLTRCDRWYSRG